MPPLPGTDFEIIRNDKPFRGTYRLSADSRRVIVTAENGASKTTQVGGTPVESLARVLLAELYHEGPVRCPTCKAPMRLVDDSYAAEVGDVGRTYECPEHGRWNRLGDAGPLHPSIR